MGNSVKIGCDRQVYTEQIKEDKFQDNHVFGIYSVNRTEGEHISE